MRLSGANLTISCVMMYLLVACQLVSPVPILENQSSPTPGSNNDYFLDEVIVQDVITEERVILYNLVNDVQ